MELTPRKLAVSLPDLAWWLPTGVCSIGLIAGKPPEGIRATELPACQTMTIEARKKTSMLEREREALCFSRVSLAPSTSSFQLAREKCSNMTRRTMKSGFVAEG